MDVGETNRERGVRRAGTCHEKREARKSRLKEERLKKKVGPHSVKPTRKKEGPRGKVLPPE